MAAERTEDLALSVYVEELARGRRVLWIGSAAEGSLGPLGKVADVVRVLSPEGRHRRGRRVRVSPLNPGPLSLRPGSFDLVVVPDLGAASMTDSNRIAELKSLLCEGGVLVVGVASGGRDLDYQGLFELVRERFSTLRMLGQAAFDGWSLVDFEAVKGGYDVTVDGSLVAPDQDRPVRYLAFCSDAPLSIDAYAIVRVQGGATAAPGPEPRVGDQLELLELELRERMIEIEAAHEHAEAIESLLAQRSTELEGLRVEVESVGAGARALSDKEGADANIPARATSDEDVVRDFVALERRLEECGKELLLAQREIEARAVLVRDMAEELTDLRASTDAGATHGSEDNRGATSEREAALQRAMAAEARAVEAQFRIDELLGQLSGSTDEEASRSGHQEATLLGTVRGLKSRIAELEELRELAEGRFFLAQFDLLGLREDNSRLERELIELREEYELELVRARGKEARPAEGTDADIAASERRLSKRVADLSGQLSASQDLCVELRAERVRQIAPQSLAADEQVAALRGEVAGLRARLSHCQNAREALDSRVDGLEKQLHAREVVATRDELHEHETSRVREELELLGGELERVRSELHDRDAELSSLRGELGKRTSEIDELLQEGSEGERELADIHELAELEAGRAAELAATMAATTAARDGLITRLQMELTERDVAAKNASERLARASLENDRLRVALISASERVDAFEAGAQEIAALRAELDDVKGASARQVTELRGQLVGAEASSQQCVQIRDHLTAILDETREVLREVASVLDASDGGQDMPGTEMKTSVGLDAASGDSSPAEIASSREPGAELVGSLRAEIARREERVRTLESQLEDASNPEATQTALRRELREMEERVGRLSEELRLAREAQRARAHESPVPSDETRELRASLGSRDVELLRVRDQMTSAERNMRAMRDAAAKARAGLEEMLGEATATGDPRNAERIGTVLKVLSQL